MCKNTMSIHTALTIWLTGWLAPHTWAFTKRLECIQVSKGVQSAGLRLDYQCERSSVHRTTTFNPAVIHFNDGCAGTVSSPGTMVTWVKQTVSLNILHNLLENHSLKYFAHDSKECNWSIVLGVQRVSFL